MPRDEEEPVPLARIIRSLNTLRDRHAESLSKMALEHEKEMKELRGRFDAVDEALLSRDCLVDELERVIATLCTRIERVQVQLRNDNQKCVYSEPLELMNLLGRSYDPSALVAQAREKAREAKRQELKRQEQEARKPSEPVKDEDPTVECECGKTWPDGRMRVGHNDMACFRACRVCGHHEDSHVEALPEEGGQTYCRDCSGTGPVIAKDHVFDGAICADWDRCLCGHDRREHRTSGPNGAYCQVCRPEYGRHHEFALKH